MEQKIARRSLNSDISPDITVSQWRTINTTKEDIVYDTLPVEAFVSFKMRTTITLLDIFLTFYTEELVEMIVRDTPDVDLVIHDSSSSFISTSRTSFMKFVAICIRMQGLQGKTSVTLKEAISESRSYFSKYNVPGLNALKSMIARLKIRHKHYDYISKRFQSIILDYGQCVCCDEKLFKFTGASKYIRMVPRKPSRVGLWIYEAVGQLSNSSTFIIYLRLHDSQSAISHSVPVSSIVQDWIDILRNSSIRFNDKTLLVMDSYYMDNTSRAILQSLRPKIKAISALSLHKFQDLKKLTDRNKPSIGSYYAYENTTTGEILGHYNDIDTSLGERIVLTTSHKIKKIGTKSMKIPVYDDYGSMFNFCDIFNRSLHGCTWPYRNGSGKRCGELGAIHDFALSCILKNTFAVYIF